MTMMTSVYFMIEARSLTQRHINLSINPDGSTAMLPTCSMGATLCYILEVTHENRFNETFLDYKGYSQKEALGLMLAPKEAPKPEEQPATQPSILRSFFGLS